MVVKGLLIGAGLGAIAIVLYKRFKDAQTEAPSTDKCIAARDLAEKAQPGAGAAAYAACKALGAIKDKLVTPWDDYDAENKRLNGEVELALAAGVRSRVERASDGQLALRGSVQRFKNGCAPFEGAPGWDKCAPGTHDMKIPISGGSLRTRKVGDPSVTVAADFSRGFSDAEGDPFTQGPFNANGKRPAKVTFPDGSQSTVLVPEAFDLPLAKGETGWIAHGVPFKCAEGTSPDWNVVDHRDPNAVPPCAAAGNSLSSSSPPPPAAAPADSAGGVRSSVGCDGTNAPAGFTWVEASGTTPGHWERLRAGQSGPGNPGPCDPNYATTATKAVLVNAPRASVMIK